MAAQWPPDGLPVLSRGKHRSARKGACFMEMASVLANEPWSDHPKCTHPLIGSLARLVNDNTSDGDRGELAALIPSVVGLQGGGLAWTIDVTSAVALQAIPDVPESMQRALAAGLIRCEEMAATLGPDEVTETDAIGRALEKVPGAVAWAREFTFGGTITAKQFEKRTAPSVIRCAVNGTVESVVPDPAGRLRELLRVAIATAERHESRTVEVRSGEPVLEGVRRSGGA